MADNGRDDLPMIYVAWGEFFDKLSILEIKTERIEDNAARANVQIEMNSLNEVLSQFGGLEKGVNEQIAQLKAVNELLWGVEDEIRKKESRKEFDERFIELSRTIYFKNDLRAKIKREINLRTKSRFLEEKSYDAY